VPLVVGVLGGVVGDVQEVDSGDESLGEVAAATELPFVPPEILGPGAGSNEVTRPSPGAAVGDDPRPDVAHPPAQPGDGSVGGQMVLLGLAAIVQPPSFSAGLAVADCTGVALRRVRITRKPAGAAKRSGSPTVSSPSRRATDPSSIQS